MGVVWVRLEWIAKLRFNMRCAALHTKAGIHLLDHIAPLADLMDMPLLIAEEHDYSIACNYYPQVDVRYVPELDVQFAQFAQTYDTLFACQFWAPHAKKLFFDAHQKDFQLVFCPHGQSDKGYAHPLLAPYAQQDVVLLYGELLQTMLKELGITARSAKVGNYRLSFYLKHKKFYDELAEQELFSRIPQKKRTLLYAPTWNDADTATTFFQWAPTLLSNIPEEWNILIKLHPLLEQRDPVRFYQIAALAENKPNAMLVLDFPVIYPLLARSDIYLGDYSSVGYDYLFFQRPMFFFLHPSLPQGRLHTCGTILSSPKDLFLELERKNDCKEQQKALYRYAFAEYSATKEDLKEQLIDRLGS